MATFKELKKEINKGNLKNVYIFVGEEREIMRKYIQQIDPKYLIAEKFEQLIPKLRAKSLVSTSITYVLKGDQQVTKLKLDELTKLVGINRLILCYEASDARLSLFKSGKGVTYTFDRIKNGDAYVRQLMGSLITPEASILVAERCGGSVAHIENEVDKLMRVGKPVDSELVMALVPQTAENRIWDFIDCILAKDAEKVFKYYAELKELKESEVKFVSLLFTGYKNLIAVYTIASNSPKEISAKTGIQAWAVGKSQNLINRYIQAGGTIEGLIRNLGLVHQLEIGIKTGRVEIENGFKNMLVNLLL